MMSEQMEKDICAVAGEKMEKTIGVLKNELGSLKACLLYTSGDDVFCTKPHSRFGKAVV